MKKIFFLLILLSNIIITFGQNKVKFVDLGLPSGILWADRNVGADNIYDYGDYYAWGEIEPKKKFKWSNYRFKGPKLYKSYGPTFAKYVPEQNIYSSPVDNKYLLEEKDDVCSIIYGKECRMPTLAEMEELLKNCKWTRSSFLNVEGYKVIGKNGNSIFIPCGGSIIYKENIMITIVPNLWTSTLSSDQHAWRLDNNSKFHDIDPQYIGLNTCIRYAGLNIRAVKPSIANNIKPELTWKSPFTATSKDYTLWVGVKSSATITDTKVYHNGQLSRGVVPVKNDGDEYSIKRNLTLVNGENVIRIDVANESGTASIERTIPYETKNPIPTPNIVVRKQNRLALVIGNSKYTNATSLTNPDNDAYDVSSKLRSLGFDVIEKHNLTKKDFKDVIRDFGNKAQSYDVCLLYYAGHAIENNGKNYLIPVDVDLKVQADVEDECVRADYVIENLENAKSKMNIIILDACRNNPIPRSWSRGVSGGLSSMTAPSGTFIAFSTSPGRTADDGLGRNSPFTEAFLKNLDLPNTQLEVFFKKVQQDVSRKTSNRQIPWIESSFVGDFYFNISK